MSLTKVHATDFHYDVAEGKQPGMTTWNKWGHNTDIDVGTETVWTPGGLFVRLSSAETLDLVSSDANDTSAGTGAQSVVISGIDNDFLEISEVVTLNGTTPVTTTNSFLGINRIAVYLAGSGESNAGTITATASTASTVQAEIPIGMGTTQHAFFFVAADHTALMDWLWINAVKTSGGGKPVLTFNMYVTSLVSNARYDVFQANLDVALENTISVNPSQPFVVGEKSLIELQCTSDTNNAEVNARFSFINVTQV